MKKILLLISMISFMLVINAQEFNGGIYGSALMSQVDGDLYGGYNKFGFAGGAYVNRFIKDELAFQMGLRYIQKGSRAVDNYYKAKLHYVEMPVTARYYPKKKLGLDIEGGLGLGYLMKAYEEIGGYEVLDAPPFNKFELSLIAGVNYELNETISIGGHFSYSILFIRPHSQDYNTVNEGQHNNLISFTVAYKLSNWR